MINKIKIGITGQSGFIGTNLFNTLGLHPEKYTRATFYDNYFQDENKLFEFVRNCDVIVHLAGMNRHHDPDVIYKTNIQLVKQLINACEITKTNPYLIFSSSIQEEKDNLYGKSKKDGRELFEKWANLNSASLTTLIIPNVFGPFGQPFYNSVVATFCYQLTHNEIPKIETDCELKLIYIGELIQNVLKNIDVYHFSEKPVPVERYEVPFSYKIKVSELLEKLNLMKESYFETGLIPDLDEAFDRNLFNTFLTYIDHATFFPFKLRLNTDDRGTFVETIKLTSGGQVSFSTTKPGITRGNHYHTRKAERFAVIKGNARIEFRRSGTTEIFTFELTGDKPSFVDMPVWYTHSITNIGNDELYTIFWISELFDPADPDTFFESVYI